MGTYGANASLLACRILNIEVVVHGIERMYRDVLPSKVKTDVQHLPARDRPPLLLGVVDSTLDTTVDCIRDLTRNLTESEPRIEHGNELSIRGFGDN